MAIRLDSKRTADFNHNRAGHAGVSTWARWLAAGGARNWAGGGGRNWAGVGRGDIDFSQNAEFFSPRKRGRISARQAGGLGLWP